MLASIIAEARISSAVVEEAKVFLARVLLPREITRSVVEKYIRKAFVTRTWHRLGREQRMLLLLTRRLVARVRSPVLRRVLEKIFLEIELATVRGRALLLGIARILGRGAETLTKYLKNVTRLLVEGLQLLNHPLYTNPTL